MCPPFLRIKFTAKIMNFQECPLGIVQGRQRLQTAMLIPKIGFILQYKKNPKNLLFLLFSHLKIGWTYSTPPSPIRRKVKIENVLFVFYLCYHIFWQPFLLAICCCVLLLTLCLYVYSFFCVSICQLILFVNYSVHYLYF